MHRTRVGLFYDTARKCSNSYLITSYEEGLITVLYLYYGVSLLPVLLYTIFIYSRIHLKGNNLDIQHKCVCIRSVYDYVYIFYIILSLVAMLWLVYQCGDVESNPGPFSNSSTSSDSYESLSNLDKLSFVHLNVQSLKQKLDIVHTELRDCGILSFTETWLHESDNNESFNLPGYHSPFCFYRNDRIGGGISVYVSDKLVVNRRDDLEVEGVECVWVEIISRHSKFLFGTFYRPPNSNVHLWNRIELSIDQAFDTGVHDIIITGDFNVDLLHNHPHQGHLSNIMNTYNLSQLVTECTHYTEHNSSLLDLILVSNITILDRTFVGESFLDQPMRYHCPVFGILNIRKVSSSSYARRIWLYEYANFDRFRTLLRETDWSFLDSNDIDSSCTLFTDKIINIAKICIPNKSIIVKSRDLPWMCHDIRKLISKRKKLHNKAKVSNSQHDWLEFKRIRNKCVNMIRQSKEKYLNKMSSQLTGNSRNKSWWKIVHNFIKPDPNKLLIPPIVDNGNYYEEDIDKANVFNNYFASQAVVDDSETLLPDDSSSYTPNNLSDIAITSNDVKDILVNLDASKAVGPDLISPRILKNTASVICVPLSMLFNKSLSLSKIPSIWKQANVTPVHKKGTRDDVKNYRPISLLSVIGKVFERCIFKYLHNFIRENNLITSCQSGFTPGDSTINQLLSISNDVGKALDTGKEFRVVFCDVSKAFDRVWHRGLLFKLTKFGISGKLLKWFDDYLSNRKQRVILNNCNSEWTTIKAGVPQGSILGPLLFLVYINDIVSDINSIIKLFADDTSLYLVVDNPVTVHRTLESDLEKIHVWSRQWLVDFNPTKTETMLISRKRTPIHHPDIHMNDIPINNVQSHKHLGVFFSGDGYWLDHVNYVISKTSFKLNVMRSLKFQLDRQTLQTIYFSFIRPLLEYGDIAWGNLSNELEKRLENLNIEAARIVTGATKLTSIDKLFKEAGWTSLYDRRQNRKILQFHKMFYQYTPAYLSNLIPTTASEGHRYETRNSDHAFITPILCKTSFYKQSFLPSTINQWNKLPSDVRSNPSVSSLKLYLDRKVLTNIPVYYNFGSRKGQIYHARLRMQCSSLNDHLFRKNIVHSPLCLCGRIESTYHYLFECMRYADIRRQYLHSLPYNITLDLLLFGSETLTLHENKGIFLAVHNYILKSNRFSNIT